jgi:hypothetical protein
MSDDGTLIPISDEQAKFGQEIIKAFSGLGSFFKDCLGSAPQDLVGYLGGDWLRFRRAENIAEMMKKAQERLKAWGVKEPESASLSVALPILRGAADESREELQDLWASLLAAAMDPLRAGRMRQGFAEALSKMDPLDALVIKSPKVPTGITYTDRENMAHELGVSRDEIDVSISNLIKLELFDSPRNQETFISPFGREFLRVVAD